MGKIISVNPATEEIYGQLDESSDSGILEKVKIANENKEWAGRSVYERVEIISGLIDLLDFGKEEIARIAALEMGKPLKAGRHEVEITKKRIFDYCKLIPGYIDDELLFDSDIERNIAVFESLGTVVVISPWNAPVFIPFAIIIPALLCGCNVIWKPSEYTSFVGLRISKLFEDLRPRGFPQTAFQIVLGGKETGRKLVESDVNMVVLTGSVMAGMEVGKAAGSQLKKFVLELGGKDAAIVLEDADIAKTAREIVKSSTMYTGQVCFGVERVYCHAYVYDAFVELCVEESKKLKVGDPLNEDTDIGPFAVKFQMEKVMGHINDAIDKGSRLLIGGKRLGEKGYFMSPGVMVDVDHNMQIMREETFGPITPIMKFQDIEKAIKLANDSEYGLTASIWTGDLLRGEEIARKIEAGTVGINRHGMSKVGCPWGGYKKSGIGRIYSKEGVREFCNIKHIWVVKG